MDTSDLKDKDPLRKVKGEVRRVIINLINKHRAENGKEIFMRILVSFVDVYCGIIEKHLNIGRQEAELKFRCLMNSLYKEIFDVPEQE